MTLHVKGNGVFHEVGFVHYIIKRFAMVIHLDNLSRIWHLPKHCEITSTSFEVILKLLQTATIDDMFVMVWVEITHLRAQLSPLASSVNERNFHVGKGIIDYL